MPPSDVRADYDVDIRWTTHGVPHITAGDWGSLGFGQGYACAQDHGVAIADHVLKVRSERSAHLGRGTADRHLWSDLGYRVLEVRRRADAAVEGWSEELRQLIVGYAAGYNEWLAGLDRATLPQWCGEGHWIRSIDVVDLASVYVDLALLGSGRNLVEYLGSAEAPDGRGAVPPPLPPPEGDLSGSSDHGSNGWALGGQATANRRGMVMANPHFPWYGEGKLWECHLRIPGEMDVYGAALVGCPGVQIGFNHTLAWTHTFSRGHRFCVYKLELVPDEPTRYVHGGERRDMVPATHEVVVRQPDGERLVHRATRWSTHHGPVLNLPLLGWTAETGFAYRDANADNDWFLEQTLAQCRATSVPSLAETYERIGGLPWVNTLAADREGRCWYIDSSATPALSSTAQQRYDRAVDEDPLVALLAQMRVAMLDGSEPDDDWLDHPAAPAPGLVPFADLPQVHRDDHVFNANDPYWLAHPTEQLPRHSPMHGLYHRPVSARTRANALALSGQGAVRPSDTTGRFRRREVEQLLAASGSLLAEQLRRPVVDRLRDAVAQRSAQSVGSSERSAAMLEELADVLASWDGTFTLDAVGAPLWRELLAGFGEDALTAAGPLWADGWSPDDPVGTPRGLAPPPLDGPDPLVAAALAAGEALAAARLAPGCTLRDCQWVSRGGTRIPVPGGGELEGVMNISMPVGSLARADLAPDDPPTATLPGRTERTGLTEDGYRITYGASFIMVVGFEDAGPVARGSLVYGQSDDPGRPEHADQVDAFGRGVLRDLLFDDEAIDADPMLRRQRLRGPR